MCANKSLSLSAYQQLLGDAIRSAPGLHGVWVTAELSDVRLSGGHCYMEIIEKDELTGQVIARMRAMIWSNAYRLLQRRFVEGTGESIRSGMKVMVKGSATHHNVFGLAFNIIDIDPAYTLGDIERQRREILAALQSEGVADLNKNLPFPLCPQKIAVISAPGAAGYGDFTAHLLGSAEGFKFYPLLIEAVMQGERTASSVLAALDFVESTLDFWDCVVIIRGGGSTTDMHGFDNYDLARRVAEFPLPVVVGIGHERDRNVLDELACRRCKTPTAVADFLVDCCRHTWGEISGCVKEIADYVSERMYGEKLRLSTLGNLLPSKVENVVLRQNRNLDEILAAVRTAYRKKMNETSGRLDIIALRLENSLKNFTLRPKMRIKNIEDLIRVLSPENTLKRGYSITRINGHAVYDASVLKPGDEIVTVFSDGEVCSEVKRIR